MSRANEPVARALRELADLMELHGGDHYRILGYRRAADAVAAYGRDVSELDDRELLAIRGVGRGTAARVREYLETGTMAVLEELRGDVPAGVVRLTEIPGLGPKRAIQLYRSLGVQSVDELKAAVESGRVRELPGFGEKAERKLAEALAGFTGGPRRLPLHRALAVAEAIVAELERHPAVDRCAYAGSVRRMRDSIGDLDVLVASTAAEDVSAAFRELSHAARVEASGDTKTSVVTFEGLEVDLRVVPPESFGAALQYFTGSKAHNVKVREHAVRRGFKLSEYGLFEGERRVAGATEEEVYEALGMRWVPPTMREDLGEVEAALRGELPRVVDLADLRGDLQSHSTYSDGRATLREMALAAADRGYEYYAITDHAPGVGAFMTSTLDPDAIERQRAEIDAINAELRGRITVLHGVELNIGPDGELDYPDDVLARFDIRVASLHSGLRDPREKGTRRVLRAIENPYVNVIGHPTGRRLDRRPGVDLDIPAVARAAARAGVALEINAYPERLDLRDEHVRWAREQGVRFAISTDAHSPRHFAYARFGVGNAQRGWVTADEVINTWPLDRLRAFLRRDRG